MLRTKILRAIVHGKLAWMTTDMIAETTVESHDAVHDELAELDREGMIEYWDSKEGLAVTLTPLGSLRCGVELNDDEEPRWIIKGSKKPPLRATGVIRNELCSNFAWLTDDRPGPLQTLINGPSDRFQNKRWQGRFRIDQSCNLPMPTSFFNAVNTFETEKCCCPEKMEAYEYCLVCDRWGLDDKLGIIKELPPTPLDQIPWDESPKLIEHRKKTCETIKKKKAKKRREKLKKKTKEESVKKKRKKAM